VPSPTLLMIPSEVEDPMGLAGLNRAEEQRLRLIGALLGLIESPDDLGLSLDPIVLHRLQTPSVDLKVEHSKETALADVYLPGDRLIAGHVWPEIALRQSVKPDGSRMTAIQAAAAELWKHLHSYGYCSSGTGDAAITIATYPEDQSYNNAVAYVRRLADRLLSADEPSAPFEHLQTGYDATVSGERRSIDWIKTLRERVVRVEDIASAHLVQDHFDLEDFWKEGIERQVLEKVMARFSCEERQRLLHRVMGRSRPDLVVLLPLDKFKCSRKSSDILKVYSERQRPMTTSTPPPKLSKDPSTTPSLTIDDRLLRNEKELKKRLDELMKRPVS